MGSIVGGVERRDRRRRRGSRLDYVGRDVWGGRVNVKLAAKVDGKASLGERGLKVNVGGGQ